MAEDFDAVLDRVEERHNILDKSVDHTPYYVTIETDKIGVPLTPDLMEMGWAITACMRQSGGLRVWFRPVEVEEVEHTVTEQVVTF